MGFNATVLVMLDRLDEIEKDPYFGRNLARAIRERGYRPDHDYLTGQTQVIDVQHADTVQVIAVGANFGRVLGYGHWTSDDKELIEVVAQQVEYREQRKPRPKDSAGRL